MTVFFFVGVCAIAFIDRLVPSYENPHEIKNIRVLDNIDAHSEKKLLRMGLFSVAVIAFHNFPEGLVTFVATMESPEVGLNIAIAIALHNIPEGIAIAAPLYYATKSKIKAGLFTLASGLAEVA